MSEKLLNRVRKLNWVLSERSNGYVSFDELCEILYELLDSNVYIFTVSGKILSSKYKEADKPPIRYDEKHGSLYVLPQHNKEYMKMDKTVENLTGDSVKAIFGEDYTLAYKYHTIVPIIFGGERIATVFFSRPDQPYTQEDIAICEYGATLVGIEVARGNALEKEEDKRMQEIVEMAMSTLSYSESEAVVNIFDELKEDEGLLVASKVADKSGITRSVIVNALRKLESAGVIETRSLGMKGTRIRIINEYLRDGIEKLRY